MNNNEDKAKPQAAPRYVSYLRVSTARQFASGLSIEAQREKVAGYVESKHGKLLHEVTEQESGKRDDRPQLARALSLCRRHRATLVVAKLDRLARSVKFTTDLLDSKQPFVALDLPEANELTIHIMAAMAQHEGKVTSARTTDALKAAKARRAAQGLPPLGGIRHARKHVEAVCDLPDEAERKTALMRLTHERLSSISAHGHAASLSKRRKNAAANRADIVEAIDEIRATGPASLRVIARRLNEDNVAAPRGGQWSASQVRRMLSHVL